MSKAYTVMCVDCLAEGPCENCRGEAAISRLQKEVEDLKLEKQALLNAVKQAENNHQNVVRLKRQGDEHKKRLAADLKMQRDITARADDEKEPRNIVLCKECLAVLESVSQHDFVQCACSNGTFTDGGPGRGRRHGGKVMALVEVMR